MIKHTKNKRGFTIIEVVLVLAIAGLIFLMVFIALPALQRNQRNTQVKNDADRVLSLIESYRKHNSGKLPFDYNIDSLDTKFVTRYIDNTCKTNGIGWTTSNIKEYLYKDCGAAFTAPDGRSYNVRIIKGNTQFSGWSSDNFTFNNFYFEAGSKCGETENLIVPTGKPRDYSVSVKLEGYAVYCVDNS